MDTLLRLSRIIDAVSRSFGKFIIWLVLAATVISAANAVARKAFNFGSNAFLEIQWYLFGAVFLLGAGYTFLQNAHVRIDVVASRLSMRTRMFIDIAGIIVFLLPMCWLMIAFALPVVKGAYLSGEMSSNAGGLIRWPVYALVPIGFALLGLQGISELIKRFAFLQGKVPNPLLHGAHDSHNEAHAHHDNAGEVQK
ncbi:TRAP transporter small permease subunit [Thauera sp. 2A1]|uniref:TRAP transporter small permease subunit n=1 Tax=Thauera sp. 2A1 TaxID=2570191 RepID=UPI001291E37D|nr:TRAP transporter small permease subunit [Thauera sp. 2A1]KAI5914561.1 TRAP transporter small permease subunit [Thauera sp. 2A1]